MRPKLPFASAGWEAGMTTRTAASSGITSKYLRYLCILLSPFLYFGQIIFLQTPNPMGGSRIAPVCECYLPHHGGTIPRFPNGPNAVSRLPCAKGRRWRAKLLQHRAFLPALLHGCVQALILDPLRRCRRGGTRTPPEIIMLLLANSAHHP